VTLLWAQIEDKSVWILGKALAHLENSGKLRRPITQEGCHHNAHMYCISLESLGKRSEVIEQLKKHCINAVFHYVPLHSSPAGKRYGRISRDLGHTDNLADRLLRLPLWVGMGEAQDLVISALADLI
jgi:dTDP-4-amino-4,6-dideoxygalactose transaminase